MVQETTDPHEFNGSKVDELMTLCGQLETIRCFFREVLLRAEDFRPNAA